MFKEKDNFAERSSALILISLVVLGLIQSYFSSKSGENTGANNIMIFPAYRTEESEAMADSLNSAMPFAVKIDLPRGWTITTDAGDTNWPAGEIYTPYYIYDENGSPMAKAGFNVFMDDSITEIDYDVTYKMVWPQLRLSARYQWEPFKPVLNGFTSQIGVADIWYQDYTQFDNYPGAMASVPRFETVGILAYDINVKAYFGIAFMPGVMDEAGAIELAKTVRIQAQ